MNFLWMRLDFVRFRDHDRNEFVQRLLVGIKKIKYQYNATTGPEFLTRTKSLITTSSSFATNLKSSRFILESGREVRSLDRRVAPFCMVSSKNSGEYAQGVLNSHNDACWNKVTMAATRFQTKHILSNKNSSSLRKESKVSFHIMATRAAASPLILHSVSIISSENMLRDSKPNRVRRMRMQKMCLTCPDGQGSRIHSSDYDVITSCLRTIRSGGKRKVQGGVPAA
jgi:hypothetical protein